MSAPFHYGQVIHVVGTYEGLEVYERAAYEDLRQGYDLTLRQGQIPLEGTRVVVSGPISPVENSTGNRVRHYMAWILTSPTLMEGSPFYAPSGFGFVLDKDQTSGYETSFSAAYL